MYVKMSNFLLSTHMLFTLNFSNTNRIFVGKIKRKNIINIAIRRNYSTSYADNRRRRSSFCEKEEVECV